MKMTTITHNNRRVQIVDALCNGGDRILQIEFPGGVRSAAEQAEQSDNDQPGQSTSQTICCTRLLV
jgi:hypothetical protein